MGGEVGDFLPQGAQEVSLIRGVDVVAPSITFFITVFNTPATLVASKLAGSQGALGGCYRAPAIRHVGVEFSERRLHILNVSFLIDGSSQSLFQRIGHVVDVGSHFLHLLVASIILFAFRLPSRFALQVARIRLQVAIVNLAGGCGQMVINARQMRCKPVKASILGEVVERSLGFCVQRVGSRLIRRKRSRSTTASARST